MKYICIHYNPKEEPMIIGGKYPGRLLEDFANHLLAKYTGRIQVHIEEMTDEEEALFAREAQTVLQRARSGSAHAGKP